MLVQIKMNLLVQKKMNVMVQKKMNEFDGPKKRWLPGGTVQRSTRSIDQSQHFLRSVFLSASFLVQSVSFLVFLPHI